MTNINSNQLLEEIRIRNDTVGAPLSSEVLRNYEVTIEAENELGLDDEDDLESGPSYDDWKLMYLDR